MTQHYTPGPWGVAATADDLVLAGRTKIASTYPVGDDVWGAANARLIAAAPDGLAANIAALPMIERYIVFIKTVPAADIEQHPYLPELEQVADDLRAAIARAGAA